MISKELLLIPGINKISIININKYKLIRIIDYLIQIRLLVLVC